MKRRSYLSGFLCGIAFTLCVGTFAVIGERNGWFDWAYQTSNGSEKITNAQRRRVLAKLSLLEGYIDKYYLNDLKAADYADGLYKGLFASLNDKYAAYYSEEEYASISELNAGKYVGIGCSISYDEKTGSFILLQPYEEGPAKKAGVKSGDTLVSVDGEHVTGLDLNEVVALVKGEEGTDVILTVRRASSQKPIELVITRQEVETKTITYSMLENQIGYLAIAGFKESTKEQFHNALEDLISQDMKGLILDVRDNGGGSLSCVVDIADRLLPEGLIVYTRDKYEKGEDYHSTDEEQLDLPMVLLVNGNSASASEVLAGALKDHKAATLIGTRTYGKGIVQSIFELNDGSALKLTTSKYYTPNGYNIHEVGIEPDIELELDEKSRTDAQDSDKPDPEKDNQLKAAIQCINENLVKKSKK